ncbi:pilus assembly protein PilP [Nitrincola iocasae]|jgi:type IV pilus assembly protein PilP|uniref:Pilus assembly protein PilP n=1 Tax=Nitrincola iocasae TaxID=2614693 RepID=A0A5J6LAF6_9GAMM|nr:pilus assembly protein PilP [Nitrincola iocasae]QEW05252.1 pilus assembly protein PilP [Nitrincola iocasae]
MNRIKRYNGLRKALSARFWALALLVLLIQGCIWVEGTADLRAFVADRSSRPVGEIPPLPEFKPYEAFVYEGSSLRNPFRVMMPEVAELPEEVSEVYPDPDRLSEYLEQYAVDNLSMVGTITSPLEAELMYALVRDPMGEVHRVQMGDYLGLDNGQVIALDERRIELSEIVSNGRGGWMKRPRSIVLPESN